MSDKDVEILIELARTKREELKTMTKEDAILSLHRAGILTMDGKFTEPYAELEELFKPAASIK